MPDSVRSHQTVQIATRLLLACLALLIPACSNDPNAPPLQEKRADGTPWVARYSGLPEDVRSLDPQVAYDQMSKTVLEGVFDTLLEYHAMKTDPYELMPGLLAAMPEKLAHADGKVSYNCRLKPGIMYMDDPCFPGGKGKELTTADVQYTFQRICDPKVECPVFSSLEVFIEGLTEAYAAAKASGAYDYSKPIAGLEVVDKYNFRIHLKKPYPQLMYWMAMPFMTPTAREAVEYYDGKEHPDGPGGKMVLRPQFKWHPVSTGPFRIQEYVPAQRFRLVRNPNYKTTTFPTDGWPAEKDAVCRPLAGKQLPLVDEVQITIFREQLPMWLLTRQGYLDRVGVGKDAFNSVVTASRELSPKYRERGMSLEKDVELSSFWININMQDPILGTNKKLRQALSCSFDAKTWIDIFYNGVPTVATHVIPPGIFGYQKDFKNPYAFDLERGKRLIAEAGYPDGIDPKTGKPLEFTLDVSGGGSWERQSAEFEQQCLERLGVRIKIIENTFARQTEKMDQGNYQLASAGWGADYPDPENYYFLLYSKNFPPAGANYARYSNPEFDALYEKMAQMENTPERLELVHKMNQFIGEDAPMIFNFNKAYYVVVQPWAPRTHANMMMEGGVKYAVADPAIRSQKQKEWNPQPKWPIALAFIGIAGLIGYGVVVNRRRNV